MLPTFPTTPFVPRPSLRGAHAQTLAAWALHRRLPLPAPETITVRVAPDAEVLCRCHWQPGNLPLPTLLLVHGLEGSTESGYMRGAAHKAIAAGMNAVRMNMRNCGGTARLSRSLYHSGLSADVAAVADTLLAHPRVSALSLAGFSMGGNLVMKLAGEWGAAPPVAVCAVAAVSPALDLAPSADALHARGNRLYEWNFLRSLKRSLRRKAADHPEVYKSAVLSGFRSIRDFDDQVTARFGGFAGATDYYEKASAAPLADRITLPALVIYALDDPFIRLLPTTRERLRANPQVQLVETAHGGHCGFLAAPRGYDGRWAEQQIVEFARAACRNQTRAGH